MRNTRDPDHCKQNGLVIASSFSVAFGLPVRRSGGLSLNLFKIGCESSWKLSRAVNTCKCSNNSIIKTLTRLGGGGRVWRSLFFSRSFGTPRDLVEGTVSLENVTNSESNTFQKSVKNCVPETQWRGRFVRKVIYYESTKQIHNPEKIAELKYLL